MTDMGDYKLGTPHKQKTYMGDYKQYSHDSKQQDQHV